MLGSDYRRAQRKFRVAQFQFARGENRSRDNAMETKNKHDRFEKI